MFIKWYMVLIIDVNCRWLLQGGSRKCLICDNTMTEEKFVGSEFVTVHASVFSCKANA